MAATVVACPLCNAPLAVPPEMAGQAIACPVCQRSIRLPEAVSNAPAALIPELATAPRPQRQSAARKSSLPLAAMTAWAGILALVVVAAALVWRERSKRLAIATAPPATPVAPIVTPRTTPPQPEPPNQAAPAPAKKLESQPAKPPAPVKPLPTAPKAPSTAAPPAKKPPAAAKTTAKTPARPPRVIDVWQLPPLASSSPVALETLAGNPDQSFELSIKCHAANLSERAAIFAEPTGSNVWTVSYVADLDAPAGKLTLATIQLAKSDLTLTWTQPFADADIRRQLANCLVELREGAATRVVQLREKTTKKRLALDLSEDRQTIDFPLPDLPEASHLRLEIRDLAGFPGGTSLRGDLKSLALGKSATLEFAELPGAEIELRFLKPAATGNLALRVEPVFKERKVREYELSLSNLDQVESKVKRARTEDQTKLKQAQANLSAAQSEVRTLRANPPAPDAAPLQKTLYGRALGAALSRVNEQQNKLRLLTEQIQRADERLKAVPKMRTFIQSIHQRASFSYVLVARSGDSDVVLVDATLPL